MQYIIALLLICLPFYRTSAQPFISFEDYNIHKTTNRLPLYSQQYELGPNYNIYNYNVTILYPEFKAVSKTELQQIKKSKITKTSLPTIHKEIAVSRKQGFLNIWFAPYAFKKGKWFRITSCKIQVDSTLKLIAYNSNSNQNTTRYASHSVLAKGKWYKISVSHEGIYELTDNQIRNMGFKDPNRIKIYGYGGRRISPTFDFTSAERTPDDLQEVATFRKNKSLLFFAEGTIRWKWLPGEYRWQRIPNIFSSKSYYFITEGDSPLRIQKSNFTISSSVPHINEAYYHSLYEKDNFAWYSGGTELYDEYDFFNNPIHKFELDAPDVIDKTSAKLEIAFSAASATNTTSVSLAFNQQKVGSFNISSYDGEIENAREVRTSFSVKNVSNHNSITISSTPNHHARLNYLTLTYRRKLTGKSFVFTPLPTKKSSAILQLADANHQIQLWQIGNILSPTVEMPSTLNGTTLEVYINDASRRYIAVNVDKDYEQPKNEGEITNQDLHADGPQDMIIILPTSRRMDKSAERLATLHRSRGMRVKLVHADELYNEYSSGTPDASAYRRYIKMLYDRATNNTDLPQYLILFGGCNWDNRFLSTHTTADINPRNLLLAYEVEPTTNSFGVGTLDSYVTDDFYGFLDDNEGKNIRRDKLDISIGRMPCTNEKEAEVLVNKAINYFNNKFIGPWKDKVVMLADYGDNNLHMNDCESVVRTIEKTDSTIDLQKIYWDAYPYTTSATGNSFPQVSQIIQNEIKKGAIMFNYTGHGSPNLISHASLLKTQDFNKPNNGNLPLWVFASCEITPYDQQINDIGRTALYNTQGGALSVMCASRAVYAYYNSALNRNFCKYLFAHNPSGQYYTIGEALRMAKVKLVDTGEDGTSNKLKYVLLGDPSLSLSLPQATIVIDSINGEKLSTQNLQLSAGQKVRFSGHVTQKNKNLSSFKGIIHTKIYDHPNKVTTLNNGNKSSSNYTFSSRKDPLFIGSDSIINGEFSISAIIPRNITYNTTENGTAFFYAVDNQHQIEASGTNSNFFFKGSASSTLDDQKGPKTYIFLNQPDFPDGGKVGTNCTFFAVVQDSAGINAMGAGIGHNIELIIDGNTKKTIVLNDYFNFDLGSTTKGSIIYPLQNLTPGKHSLTFRIWDINDNSTTKQLSFLVDPSYHEGYDINSTQNPTNSPTQFIVTLNDEKSEHHIDIEVYDLNGHLVWQHQKQIPAGHRFYSTTWTLNNKSGQRLQQGIYLYRAIIQADKNKVKLPAKKLILTQ